MSWIVQTVMLCSRRKWG